MSKLKPCVLTMKLGWCNDSIEARSGKKGTGKRIEFNAPSYCAEFAIYEVAVDLAKRGYAALLVAGEPIGFEYIHGKPVSDYEAVCYDEKYKCCYVISYKDFMSL